LIGGFVPWFFSFFCPCIDEFLHVSPLNSCKL
jgi:hypothetical protein